VFIIYAIINKADGKAYIGKTVQTLQRRWQRHKSRAKTNPTTVHFSNAIRKYGPDAFDVSEIVRASTLEEANELERHYISTLQSYLPANGYNSTLGGEGCNFNAEVRAKISKALKGKPCLKLRGRKRPAEVCERIRLGNLGHKVSQETRAKLSAAGKTLTGARNHFYGRRHTAESIALQRAAKVGHCLSAEHRRKISLSLIGNKHACRNAIN